MFKMDLKSKGITWVGSICQRFESVCQEVDSLMAQEKVKYVKRQVQISCENVQKLYAETVQDLIPFPTSDSVKGYRYISEMFEGEKTKVGSEENFKDERLSSSSQSERIASMDNDSSAIHPGDSCSANENTLLHCKLEASGFSDKESSAIPLLDSANENVLLHSQLDARVDSFSAKENVSLHSRLQTSSLDKVSSSILLMDSCSLYSHLEESNSLDKDSSAVPLVDSFSLHSQLEPSISLDKDSSAIPLVDSCSTHSQLEETSNLDKDLGAIPPMDSCSLHSQLESSTALDKESSIISLVDSCPANENALLHHQLETSFSVDKDSSANACSPNESMSCNSQFEASISLNEDPGVASPCSGYFTDEELYLPFQSNVSVSMDEIPNAASLHKGMKDINQPETCDAMMNTNTVSVEDTEKYYTQTTIENNGNSDAGSWISESSNVLRNELVIPAVPNEKVREHGSMLLVLESSTDFGDSSARANHVETCIATEESTQIPTEVVGQNCPRKAGGSNNVPYEVSSVGHTSSFPQPNLVLQDASHRETVDDKSITSNYISSLSIDFADTFRSSNEISQVESLCNKCEKDSKHTSIGASLPPTAVSTISNNFDCEESLNRADAVGLNSVTEEEFEDVILEDDFVDSEAEKDEVYLITLLASRKRSYKKKLQDALLSTIRTTRRDDGEEVIAWYRDFNKSTKHTKNLKEMQFEDGTESDWELV